MMHIREETTNRRRYYLLGIIAATLVFAALFFVINQRRDSTSTTTPQTTTEGSAAAPQLQPQAALSDPGATQRGVDTDSAPTDTAASRAFPTTQPNLAVTITSTDIQNGTLVVKTTITPTAQGTCAAQISGDTQTYATKTISFQGTSCENLSFDISKLEKGTKVVTVVVMVGPNVATASLPVTIR